MTIELPHSFADLSVKQLIILHTSGSDNVCLMNLTGLNREELLKRPKNLLDAAYEHLKELRSQEHGEHLERLLIDGVEYGFINDWDAFSFGEYIDIQDYAKDVYTNAEKMLSLLYRPIIQDNGKDYTIAPYTSKENEKVFENVPATVLAGAMLFFWTSKRDLLNPLRRSLREAIVAIASTPNGVGTLQSLPLQMKTS